MANWKSVYDALKNSGMPVYQPGSKTSECTSTYCVVKQNGGSNEAIGSIQTVYYNVLVYVPKNRYEDIEQVVKDVKKTLNALYPALKFTNSETSPYFDDSVKGWMVNLTYQNYRLSQKGTV